MKKSLITIGMSLAIATMASAQLKVTSEGTVGITTTTPNAALDLGTAKYVTGNPTLLFYNDNSSGPFAGTKCGFYMDNFGANNVNLVFPEISAYPGLFTICGKNTSGTTLNKYFSITGMTGYVGIGTSTPNYKLDVFSWGVRFASTSQLFFYQNNPDPRICSSTNNLVFYKWDNSGYINLHCLTMYEHSDSTSKKNFVKIANSLSKIRKIEAYNYYWKTDKKNENKQTGLLAQQIEKIIPEVVITDDSTGNKMISYTHIIPYLIDAINEQSNTIDSLKKQVSDFVNCCNSKNGGKLKSFDEDESTEENSASTNNLSDITVQGAKLYQNAPNPFKQSTTIKLEIPQTVGSAMVCIYDLTGKQLKCLTATGRGTTSVQIFANELTAGMYHYALIADGVLIDTKTMVLTE